MTRAFTDFYSQHGAELVSRQYVGRERLFRSREALFLSLGVPPSSLHGRSILEFGPGTGHYSVFNLAQDPESCLFVEGVPAARDALEARVRQESGEAVEWSVDESYFEDFDTRKRFDFVIAESCIPHQKDPRSLFRQFSTYVKPGGILVITTASGASYLSETLRRLVRDKIISPTESVDTQLKIMTPIFAKHLSHLNGVSRNAEDWVLDAIIQPLGEVRLFGIAEAITAVDENFYVLGSAPKFIQDFAWHRTLANPEAHSRETALKSYFCNLCNLLDVRHQSISIDREVGQTLERFCNDLWEAMGNLEAELGENWNPVFECLKRIEKVLIDIDPPCRGPFQEVADWLSGDSKDATALREFPQWWGVGQQHLAFYRGKYFEEV